MNFIKNKKFLLPLLVMVFITGIGGYFVVANTPIEIELTIDGENQKINTNKKSFGELIEELGYNLKDIKTDNELDAEIKSNQKYILNTKKDITFNNAGSTLQVSTFTSNVEEFLKEFSVEPDTDDVVTPSKDTNIKSGDTISFDNITIENYSKNLTIKYTTKEQKSFDVKFGETLVKTEGKDGSKVQNYTKITKNGNVVSDRLVNENIVVEPVDEIKLIGTKEIVSETVDFETIEQENSSMYKDESEIIQDGIDGKIEYTYENDGTSRKLVKKEVKTEVQNKIVEYGTKSRPAYAGGSSTSSIYSLNDLKFYGIINWNGLKFTYYSQSVLPGGGLSIPGRHINDSGYVADSNGYIVVAHRNAAMGSIINTPFGYQAKVYDRCGNCALNHYDVYTK